MPYRVFITGSYIAQEAEELLADKGCEYRFGHESDTPEAITGKVRDYRPDALIVRKGRITADVLRASPNLRAVTKHGVGVDNIDVDAATRLRIPVMITAYANFESVAEHTLALILSTVRRIPGQNAYVRDGNWDKSGYDGGELLGKTLGLVGFGRIGRRVAEIVEPFRMKVLVFDPYLKPGRLPAHSMISAALDDLLSRSDIVSLHCPLTPETRGLIGARELGLMKREAWIVNTARGPIIDESALVAALRDNSIAGAALDTLEIEPPDGGNPLFECDNAIVTNHIAGVSSNSFRNMGLAAVENVLGVLQGGAPDPACLVNPAALKEAVD